MKRAFVFLFVLFPLCVFGANTICQPGYRPVAYARVEYIESHATEYIDPGRICLEDDIIEMDYEIIDWSAGGDKFMFGVSVYNEGSIWVENFGTDNSWYIRYGGHKSVAAPFAIGSDVNYLLKKGTWQLKKGSFSVNGRQIARPVFEEMPQKNSLIFGRKSTTGGVELRAMRISGFRIMNNNNLIINFIPVKNTTTNEYGMYDTVSRQFFGNISGEGAFTGGPETGENVYNNEIDFTCALCPSNTYKPNAGNQDCTPCPIKTFSPIGSTSLNECAKILHVGDYVVYMPVDKRTEHGLCTMLDGVKYCADMYERQ